MNTYKHKLKQRGTQDSSKTRQKWRNRHREQTYGHRESGGEGEMYGESNMETYITIYKIDSQQEFAVWLRKLKQGLCIRGMGREIGGRLKRQGIYAYLWLIHVEVFQKTTKFCKAIILRLKNKYIFKNWDCFQIELFKAVPL